MRELFLAKISELGLIPRRLGCRAFTLGKPLLLLTRGYQTVYISVMAVGGQKLPKMVILRVVNPLVYPCLQVWTFRLCPFFCGPMLCAY